MFDLARQFLRFELAEARQELVSVDDVAVDFRAVDHDRVQAGDGLDSVALGQVAHGAHHQRWANGDDFGDLATLAFLVGLEQCFERARDETQTAWYKLGFSRSTEK